MPKKSIPTELIAKTRAWLGDDGYRFFEKIKAVHGTVNACWNDGGIPHPVHFREGMQIRNFMRTSGLCEGWSDHDFDDNWVELIEEAIKLEIPVRSRYDLLKGQ
jgi:hypothetical protein